jgi:hypothetical protein
MEFSINSEEYSRLIDLLNRVAGTVEPTYRYFQIYHRRGLKFFVSDGCAKLEFSSPIEVDPFTGVYTVPIDYARALKPGKRDTTVTFSTTGSQIKISTGSETLTLDRTRTEELPLMERKFEFSFRYSLKEFRDGLDFVSAASMEGDSIEIFSKEEKTYMAAAAGRLVLVASIDSLPKYGFAFSIPYVTARHLVKAFEELKVEEIDTGVGISELGFKVGPLLFSVCTDETTFSPPISLIRNSGGHRVERRELLIALGKITRLSRRGFSVLMISKNSTLSFYLKAANLRYESIASSFSGGSFVVQIDPHRLHSVVSRMKAPALNLSIQEKNLLVGSPESGRYLLIPLVQP